jgi:hypothetical protein
MTRPFTTDDDGQRFVQHGTRPGRLEFPLTDPGSGTPDEGILWYDEPVLLPGRRAAHWDYVKPIDVELLA